MKRRKFIKNISALSAAPLVLNGTPLSPRISQALLPFLMNCEASEDRSVVVLFLKGGNDGLNTILPFDQYDTYVNVRPDIALSDTGAGAFLDLDTTLSLQDKVGINPSMTSFKAMYEAGNARLVQAVGYPDHNLSHFKSTDLILGGNAGVDNSSTLRPGGWIGRFFEQAYPDVYGNPTVALPDPLGIQLGDSKTSLAFHDCTNEYQAVNLSWQNPSSLFGLLSGLGTQAHAGSPGTDYGDKLSYIMDIENSTSVYGERITSAYNAGSNSSVTYPDDHLGYDFATVARLLSGGNKTKLFQLHKGGFDTHDAQVSQEDPSVGWHSELLTTVFDSIKAFHDDLANLGLGDKVVTVVFSEFSRRITQNGNFGTDHGNFGPMFLFGEGVNPGISGTNFDLTAIDEEGYMEAEEMQHDYRSVFKTLLQDWMGAGANILDPAEFDGFTVLPELIAPAMKVTPDCYLVPPVNCPADINADGVVDVEDFVALNSQYGNDCVDCPEDINKDGTVDVDDFIQLNSAYGAPCP